MKNPGQSWEGDKWLTHCAWCAKTIREEDRAFVLKAKLDSKQAKTLPPGTVQPLELTKSKKTVPILLPELDSPARREGVDAIFQVCSIKCGRALRKALQQAPGLTEVDFAHQEEVQVGPEELPPDLLRMPQMEKMMRDLQRLIAGKHFNSVEELNRFLESLPPGPLEPEGLASQAQSPLDKAQELVYQAWEEPSPKRRLTLAKRALKVSPECADAYLLLAQEAAGNPGQQRKLYEQAVAAAERALGPEVFRNCAGHFWGVLETRPYMRARASLGQCLWSLGEPAAAIEQYQALLKLNPNDNQGNRYILSDYLLAEGRDEEFKALLKRFPSDIAAGWSYNRALWLFRTEGPGRKATNALRAALTANPFVPDYLLGAKALPAFLPPFVGMGDENEAIEYASRALENWHKTPYAVDWLRENAE